ncbi:peptide transporter [Caulobacter sp. Root655]|uniref:OPT family oligopeptide transporter n=1 Tax=Caulobacter sp. Root655 TaxID=1736578 RepID=UPI0006F3D6FA|nr:oligopeptide transporter, OPT family [Caulobacter sp. Root655]KRA66547.1 peptide transporter [Caulobacter sp. Root655]
MSSDAAATPRSEFTTRGVLLGIAITVIFTMAQVYLGLKVGLTFATSIPAAVISMALLRMFRTGTIQENNIVQTIASAAGTLSSVIFVLPGLLMIGWWSKVPFLATFGACLVGGILGVMYTIPLRRALVTNSDLPYPEGVAAAEVLKVGTGSRAGAAEGQAGLVAVVLGTVASALFAALAAAKIFAAEVAGYFKAGAGATGLGASSSLALMGAGHLMGITVGVAMFAGLAIAWGVLVPVMTSLHPMPDVSVAKHALTVWKTEVRFMGAGVIGAAAIWTLGKLAVPIWSGLVSAFEANKARKVDGAVIPRTEQDIPINVVGLVSLLLLAPAGWFLAHFLTGGPITSLAAPLVAIGIGYVLVAGLLAAAVCGYMAGLIGSSNSPVSGIAILTVLGASLMVGVVGRGVIGPDIAKALVAYALYVTTMVLAVAVVANDNLQDLKTGQLVDATPWKQQVALVIGVVAGAIVIPFVLELLNQSNGFSGAANLNTVAGATPLDAPQATLISTLAKGVIAHDLNWTLLGYGALIGLGLVLVDIVLRRSSKGRFSLPPLGVGLAIYLPSAVTAPVVVGALAGWIYDKVVAKDRMAEPAKRLGVLVASGFIVGESLFNVALAVLIVATQKASPLEVPFAPPEHVGMIFALIAAVVVVVGLYGWARKSANKIQA